MLVVDLQVTRPLISASVFGSCRLCLLNHIVSEMIMLPLQGVKEKGVFWMTDPAIHSPIEDFGRDNKRTMGMAKFFETHVCNSICDQLKLTKQK